MAFDKQYKTPSALSGVARGAFSGVYGASIVSTYLPAVANPKLTYDFDVNSVALTQAARFRSWNTESDQTISHGRESRAGKLAPISRRYNVDEYQHLQMFGGDLGAEFEKKAQQIAAEIAMRFVLAGAEAIETGKVTIEERDLSFELDYGRKPELTDTASTVWSNPAADVIGDLEALRDAYGENPGTIIVPQAVIAALSKNTGIIKFAVQRGTDLPNQVSYDDVRRVLANFNFVYPTTNDERLIDPAGNERALFSDDKVLFLPQTSGLASAVATASGSGPLGNLSLGITSEAMEPENGLGRVAGVVSGAYKTEDPNGFDVLVSAIGIPAVTAANRTASLEVL